MNFDLLKQQIINNPTLNDAELLDLLHDKNIEQIQDIQTADIKKYLIVTGKILAINASQEPAALLTVEALNTFETFQMNDPTNVNALNAQMDGLIGLGLLTESDKSYVLSLGTTHISKANQLGFNQITQGDIDAARTI